MLSNLNGYNIILGSSSYRRQELLKLLNITFVIKKPTVKEIILNEIPLKKVPLYLANLKANSLTSKLAKNDILITADTVVILDGKILGKPNSKAEAIEMLQNLSAKKHEVITGAQIRLNNQIQQIEDSTIVYFDTLSEKEITFYIDEFKPYDKAGSYGIQDWISLIGIKKIYGSYHNVMGLPIQKLYRVLKKIK